MWEGKYQGKDVLIKKYTNGYQGNAKTLADQFKAEVEFLKSTTCRTLLPSVGATIAPGNMLRLAELLRPSAAAFMENKALTKRQIKNVALDIADALIEIHKNGFIHRDVSPYNCFMVCFYLLSFSFNLFF